MLNRVAIGTICEIKTVWGLTYKGTVVDKKRKKVEHKLPLHLEIQTNEGFNILIADDDIIKYENVGYDVIYIKSLCNGNCRNCNSDEIKVKLNESDLSIEKVFCKECYTELFSKG